MGSVITVFEAAGTLHSYQTSASVGTLNPLGDWLATGLAGHSGFRHLPVSYPALLVGMGPSIQRGVNNMVHAIQALGGPFVIVGTSQGGSVASGVYDEIRSGRLRLMRHNFLGGFTFGNPRRQASHTFPGGPDPGGAGVDSHLLQECESLWWDFAITGDPVSCVGATPYVGDTADWIRRLWILIQGNQFRGTAAAVAYFVHNLPDDIAALVTTLYDVLVSLAVTHAHGEWGVYDPVNLGKVADTHGQSCYDIALQQILSLAS